MRFKEPRSISYKKGGVCAVPIPCAAKEIRSRKSLTAKEIPARALSGHNYLNGLIYLVIII